MSKEMVKPSTRGGVSGSMRCNTASSAGLFVRFPVSRAAGLMCILLFGLILYAFGRYISGDIEWGFALVGFSSIFLVSLPLLDARVGALSLWGVLWFVVFIGAGLRGVMMATGYPDRESIETLFLLGKSFDELQGAALFAVGALVLFVAAYYLAFTGGFHRRVARGEKPRRFGPRPNEIRTSVVTAVIICYAVVGAAATAAYTIAVGGISSSISDRRTTFTGAQDYKSYGIESFLAGASVVALVLYFAYALQVKKRLRLPDWIVVSLLVANAFAINVVTTARADLLFVSMGIVFVVVSIRKRIPLLGTGVAALGVLGGIAYLSADRGGQELAQNELLAFGIESGLLNRNAFDLSKTLHIITAVPDLLPYRWGSTIATYVFAPIPRAIWPDKPLVSPGPIIGDALYGLANTGIPPGMVAELVWNFGPVLGLALVPIVGYFLGKLELWGLSFDRTDILFLAFYATVILPFGKAVIGVSIGQALSAALQATALLVPGVLILLVSTRESDGDQTDGTSYDGKKRSSSSMRG